MSDRELAADLNIVRNRERRAAADANLFRRLIELEFDRCRFRAVSSDELDLLIECFAGLVLSNRQRAADRDIVDANNLDRSRREIRIAVVVLLRVERIRASFNKDAEFAVSHAHADLVVSAITDSDKGCGIIDPDEQLNRLLRAFVCDFFAVDRLRLADFFDHDRLRHSEVAADLDIVRDRERRAAADANLFGRLIELEFDGCRISALSRFKLDLLIECLAGLVLSNRQRAAERDLFNADEFCRSRRDERIAVVVLLRVERIRASFDKDAEFAVSHAHADLVVSAITDSDKGIRIRDPDEQLISLLRAGRRDFFAVNGLRLGDLFNIDDLRHRELALDLNNVGDTQLRGTANANLFGRLIEVDFDLGRIAVGRRNFNLALDRFAEFVLSDAQRPAQRDVFNADEFRSS